MGWYHTGPRLREADLDINDLMGTFCDLPILVICDIQVLTKWGACVRGRDGWV